MNESMKKIDRAGLSLLTGVDSFIQDLTEENESCICGGRRTRTRTSGRTRTRTSTKGSGGKRRRRKR